MVKITPSQSAALEWLKARNGSGALSKRRGKTRYLVAAGETSPFMPDTWEALREAGLVTIEHGRVTVKEDIK